VFLAEWDIKYWDDAHMEETVFPVLQSTEHGYPGILIGVSGMDGVGKTS
jgi:hypothetical protein